MGFKWGVVKSFLFGNRARREYTMLSMSLFLASLSYVGWVTVNLHKFPGSALERWVISFFDETLVNPGIVLAAPVLMLWLYGVAYYALSHSRLSLLNEVFVQVGKNSLDAFISLSMCTVLILSFLGEPTNGTSSFVRAFSTIAIMYVCTKKSLLNYGKRLMMRFTF